MSSAEDTALARGVSTGPVAIPAAMDEVSLAIGMALEMTQMAVTHRLERRTRAVDSERNRRYHGCSDERLVASSRSLYCPIANRLLKWFSVKQRTDCCLPRQALRRENSRARTAKISPPTKGAARFKENDSF